MVVSNKEYFIFFRRLLFVLISIIILDFILSRVSGTVGHYFDNHIPAVVSGSIIFIMAFIRVNYFSYEDEYEIIHIRSKSLIFGKFESNSKTRYEFPKRIVQQVEMKRFLFQKQLIIHLKTQHGEKKIQKFDLSFLPFEKLQMVFNSLKRISEQNNALKTHPTH